MGFQKVHKVDGVVPFRFRDSLASSNYVGAYLSVGWVDAGILDGSYNPLLGQYAKS